MLELKGLIQAKDESFPAESIRLIYSGRVLKDEDLVSKYSLKQGHTIHLVRPLARASAWGRGGRTSGAERDRRS